jgi:hypothetical protein
MEFAGKGLTIWSARAALLLYVCWILFVFIRQSRPARIASTLALSAYLFHVWCAFEYLYQWSHATAYRETARQTADLFGVRWGGGLYLNYLFTAVWLADCAESWLKPHRWSSRPAWVGTALHVFFAFMWVNATVVVWLLRAIR